MFRIQKWCVVAAILAVSAAALFAESAVMDMIQKKYSASSTLKTDFDLHIFWAIREKEETKEGRLLVGPDDKFRVEMEKDILVSDGTTYWQYNGNASQVVIKNLKNMDLSFLPSQILSEYLTKYSFTEKEKDKSQTVLEWTADSSSSSSFYQSIMLWVKTKDGTIGKLQLVDRNDNRHTYTFKRTIFGKSIPKEVFTFEPPEGTRILDNRE